MLEGGLLELVLDTARMGGWLAHHVRRSDKALQQGVAGFPDLVLVRDARVLFVELKREGAKLRPDQERWRDALRAAGADWRLWRPSDWRDIEAVLLGP
jgi:hypothetical protein